MQTVGILIGEHSIAFGQKCKNLRPTAIGLQLLLHNEIAHCEIWKMMLEADCQAVSGLPLITSMTTRVLLLIQSKGTMCLSGAFIVGLCTYAMIHTCFNTDRRCQLIGDRSKILTQRGAAQRAWRWLHLEISQSNGA